MNIHEYQGKELLRGYGVAVLDGHVAWTPEEAAEAAAAAPAPDAVAPAPLAFEYWYPTLPVAVTCGR